MSSPNWRFPPPVWKTCRPISRNPRRGHAPAPLRGCVETIICRPAGQLLGICSYVKIAQINVTVSRYPCQGFHSAFPRMVRRVVAKARRSLKPIARLQDSTAGKLKGSLYGTVARAAGRSSNPSRQGKPDHEIPAGGRRPLRTPDPPLEPPHEAVYLHPAATGFTSSTSSKRSG